MKVIIAGSRGIVDYGFIEEAVEASEFDIEEVVSGAAQGVDKLGERYAEDESIPVKRFPAQWNDIEAPGAVIKQGRYGKYNALAGYQRNQRMGEYADGLIAVWDGSSNGTRHMIQYMERLNKPVFIYDISNI
jgi:hypothetical protein